MTDAEAEALLYDWPTWARPDQLAPPGDWRTWLVKAGRGWGKTRVGAEWVRQAKDKVGRIALVAPTAADARDVMVEGESGILAISPPNDRPLYEPSKRRLTWPNGAIATTYSADEPERLRGPQHGAAWCDEVAAWRYPDAWDMLLFGLRLGTDPRVVATTTPKAVALMRSIAKDPTTVITRGRTFDNASNLAAPFLAAILRKYEGTRLGRQELEGEDLDDNPNALWQRARIDELRTLKAPHLSRVVVGVDPAISSGDDSDETGIIVAGVGPCSCKGAIEQHGFILDDATLKASPDGWGRAAVTAYHKHRADRVVPEVNQGGEMVTHVLNTVDSSVPVKPVHASRGKVTRAEPISSLYEQGKVHHVGSFAALEDQMCQWVPGMKSPDRMDACLVAGTLVTTDRGSIPIEQIVPGMMALTRQGYRRVAAAKMTDLSAPVFDVRLSNGDTLTGTGNHPVFVVGKGFTRIDALVWDDILISCKEKSFSTMGLSLFASLNRKALPLVATFIRLLTGEEQRESDRFIEKFIRRITGLSLPGTKFITWTETRSTTALRTLSALVQENIPNDTRPSSETQEESKWIEPGRLHRLGMAAKKVLRSIGNLGQKVGSAERSKSESVNCVAPTIEPGATGMILGFAPGDAFNATMTSIGPIMRTESAKYVGRPSTSKNQKSKKSVPVSVVGLSDAGLASVYNLEVEDVHEYFADGVLVHNCVWALTELMLGGEQEWYCA